MACLNLSHHHKFRQLARRLGSRALARGTLELLWDSAYEHADPYIGTPADIAEAVGWTDAPMKLVRLLISCGFLDDVGAQYVVHDLWTHAPRYVRLRWERAHPGQIRPWIRESRTDSPSTCVPDPKHMRAQNTHLSVPSHSAPVRTERTAAAPLDSIDVLTRLGHELHGQSFQTEADLKEALKALAAQHAIPYDGQSIGAALDRLTRSRRPLRVAQ